MPHTDGLLLFMYVFTFFTINYLLKFVTGMYIYFFKFKFNNFVYMSNLLPAR